MKTQYSLSLILFFFLSVPTFAQITKGSKTLIGSNVGLSIQSNSDLRNLYETNLTQLGIGLGVPYYMITNKLQVGCPISFNTYNSSNSSTTQAYTSEFSSNAINFNPSLTYFFTKDNKGFFVGVGSNIQFKNEKVVSTPVNSGNYDRSNTDFKINLAFGYILPINENVYWTGGLGYTHHKVNERLSLNVGLTNFVRKLKDNTNDTPQYLERGKSILNASLSLSFGPEQNADKNQLSIYYSQMKFRNDHFALGGYGGFFGFNIGKDNYSTSIQGGALARYYISMSKRWYIYPELGLGLSYNKQENQRSFNFDFRRSVGVNYFISPNIAFDVNVILNSQNFSQGSTQAVRNSSAYSNFGANFGFTYFVGKVF